MNHLYTLLVSIITISLLSGSEVEDITSYTSIEREKIIDYPGDMDLYRQVVFFNLDGRKERLYEFNGLGNGNPSSDIRRAFSLGDIKVLIINEGFSGAVMGSSPTHLVVVRRDVLAERIKFPHYLLVKKLMLSDGSVSKSNDVREGDISKSTINDKLELVIPEDLESKKIRYIKLLE